MVDKVYIICSAIWFDDGKEYNHQPRNIKSGFVVCGRRHHNCFATLRACSPSDEDALNHADFEKDQGFLTNTDRYVGREEALEIALLADQVLDPEKVRGGRLFSEDLY